MRKFKRYFIPRWYYYATPLFILLDYFLGINIRVSALDAMPFYKYTYYGFCILCGICMYISPRYSPIVALLESAINYILMLLLLLRPYLYFLMQEDLFGRDWQNVESINPEHICNLILVGAIAVLAFRASLNKLAADFTTANQPQIHSLPPDTD